MKKFLKLIAFSIAITSLQYCSSDILNSEPSDFDSSISSSSTERSEKKVAINTLEPINVYYSSNRNQHLFTYSDYLPSYFFQNTLGYADLINTNNPQPGDIAIYYNSRLGDSFITSSYGEMQTLYQSGYLLKYVYRGISNGSTAVPVYRYYRSSTRSHYYTTNIYELGGGSQGFVYESVAFYLASQP